MFTEKVCGFAVLNEREYARLGHAADRSQWPRVKLLMLQRSRAGRLKGKHSGKASAQAISEIEH